MATGHVSIDSTKTSQELIELTKQLKESKNQLQLKDQQLLESQAEIKKIEEEKLWINNHVKNRLTFEKNTIKTDGAYFGSNQLDGQNFLKKIGKAVDSKEREKALAASSSYEGGFRMDNYYPVYKGYELLAEKITHTVLSSLNVHIDKGKTGSTEVFVVHKERVESIMSQTADFLNRMAEEQNVYIDLLEEKSYVYPLVNAESILSIEYIERKTIEYENNQIESSQVIQEVDDEPVRRMYICHFNPNDKHEAYEDRFEIYESGGRHKNCLDCKLGKLETLKSDILDNFDTNQEFSAEDEEKIIIIKKELELITLEDIHNKHQISKTQSYQRCGCQHHIGNELDMWLLKENFTKTNPECKPCGVILRKIAKKKKQPSSS